MQPNDQPLKIQFHHRLLLWTQAPILLAIFFLPAFISFLYYDDAQNFLFNRENDAIILQKNDQGFIGIVLIVSLLGVPAAGALWLPFYQILFPKRVRYLMDIQVVANKMVNRRYFNPIKAHKAVRKIEARLLRETNINAFDWTVRPFVKVGLYSGIAAVLLYTMILFDYVKVGQNGLVVQDLLRSPREIAYSDLTEVSFEYRYLGSTETIADKPVRIWPSITFRQRLARPIQTSGEHMSISLNEGQQIIDLMNTHNIPIHTSTPSPWLKFP